MPCEFQLPVDDDIVQGSCSGDGLTTPGLSTITVANASSGPTAELRENRFRYIPTAHGGRELKRELPLPSTGSPGEAMVFGEGGSSA